jgi:trimeric autotransporter adhesin
MPSGLIRSLRHHRALLPSSPLTLARCVALSVALSACAGGADSVAGPGPGTGGGNSGGSIVATRLDLSTTTVGLGAVGASETVSAILRDARGGVVTDGAITWSSADLTVADVSVSGSSTVITARAPGRTTVRATSGSLSGEITVNVSVVRAIALPATAQVRIGTSTPLTATIDADQGANQALAWRSDNPAVAVVNGSGVVTGVTPGATVIRVSAVSDPRVTAASQLTVSPARNVAIANAPDVLFVGDELMFAATVDVEQGESRGVEWSSSNPSVVSISAGGRAVAFGVGSAWVRVRSTAFDFVRDSVRVQVQVPRVVTVFPSAVVLTSGQTRTLNAQVQIDGELSAAVQWRSLQPSVAMVSSGGVVTAVGPGTATILALAQADTTRSGSATVIVTPGVRDISVDPSSATILTGVTLPLVATVIADVGAPTGVPWRSASPAIASVSASGTVTGIAPGTVLITAVALADTMRQSTALITVRAPLSVSVSPSSLTVAPGAAAQLAVTVQGEGSSSGVTWRSSNTAVASVSASGLVTGIAGGTSTITAIAVADTMRRASATVTVSSAPSVQSVSVSPTTTSLAAGQTAQLSATVQASGGAPTTVTWTTSNPAVATVSGTGLVTAVTAGSAVVTATSTHDVTRSASAAITVSSTSTRLATSWSAARLGGALYEDVVSYAALDANTAFAVNSTGDVFRLSGGTWSVVARGSTFGTFFRAVSSASGQAMAVGTNGVVARFNGTAWSAVSSGTQVTLNDVFLESATSGFAVGAGGTALRWNGTAWTTTNTGTQQSLQGIWLSGTTAFAVGNAGEVLRWNGSSWSRQSSGTSETLYSVFGISTSNVVAVGAFGTILRFNGSSWSRVNTGGSLTADLLGVTGSSANSNRYYIASDEGLLQLNNTTVSGVSTPYAPRLFAVAFDGAGNVHTSGQRGVVMRLSGSTWETINIAPDLLDVWTTAASNAWAVGEFGSIYRWNGSSWARQSTPTTNTLNAVWGANASEAYAGGEAGTMLRWNGTSWSSMSFPSAASVYGLWGSAGNNVYAAMSDGTMLRWNGSAWSTVATSSAPLWVVFGTSPNDVYASGENGQVLRFNGTSWSTINAPTTGTLAGIWSAGGPNLLAVGANAAGTVPVGLRAINGNWSSTSLPGSALLTSVWGATADDVYATGDNGAILRWNGSTWSTMSSGATELLWSVSGAPSGTGGGFAVGYNGMVVTATSSGGLMASTTAIPGTSPSTLDPRTGVTAIHGALPSGAARRTRTSR